MGNSRSFLDAHFTIPLLALYFHALARAKPSKQAEIQEKAFIDITLKPVQKWINEVLIKRRL